MSKQPRTKKAPAPVGPWYVDSSIVTDGWWYVGNGERGFHFPTETEAIAVRDALNRVAAERPA